MGYSDLWLMTSAYVTEGTLIEEMRVILITLWNHTIIILQVITLQSDNIFLKGIFSGMLPVPASYAFSLLHKKITFVFANIFKYIPYKNKGLILHLDRCMAFQSTWGSKIFSPSRWLDVKIEEIWSSHWGREKI